ncbi:MAG: hypothetical protein HY075_10615 [Deltaproteobacteria bacterium]|nr:hypothetical protein [Deltaproteobacteria bacterium]
MDASEVFKAEDFKSVRLSITFQNLTTRTEVRDRSRVALIEVADRTILLEIPGKSCQAKHNVLIKIERPKKKAKAFELLFDATAKVVGIEDTGDGTDKVLVELVQFDLENWRRFLEVFSSRQDDIEKFLLAAKG